MKNKVPPILFKEKEDCCGCTACAESCPNNSIKMVIDEQGFEYPVINCETCICCKICIRVCPIKKRGIISKTQ